VHLPSYEKGIYIVLVIILHSCFPVSIPPNLEKGQIFKARKFKKQLPKPYSCIFADPKTQMNFTIFLSSKFPPNNEGDSETNVPIKVDGMQYFITFYETEKKSHAVNLLPTIANEVLYKNNIPVQFNESPIVRDGTWYIAIIITDEDYNDALSPSYIYHEDVLQFSRTLQNEYLSTDNYNSLLLKRKTSK
jgi:hypothetical protein